MLRGQKVLYQSVCPRTEDKTINFLCKLWICSFIEALLENSSHTCREGGSESVVLTRAEFKAGKEKPKIRYFLSDIHEYTNDFDFFCKL